MSTQATERTPLQSAERERTRQTVLAFECPQCHITAYVEREGPVTCLCGATFEVSETEGLLPTWAQ